MNKKDLKYELGAIVRIIWADFGGSGILNDLNIISDIGRVGIIRSQHYTMLGGKMSPAGWHIEFLDCGLLMRLFKYLFGNVNLFTIEHCFEEQLELIDGLFTFDIDEE